jgi:hypothetical protein
VVVVFEGINSETFRPHAMLAKAVIFLVVVFATSVLSIDDGHFTTTSALLTQSDDSVFGSPLASETASIVVPGTRSGLLLTQDEHDKYANEIASQLSVMTGGASIYHGSGCWLPPNTLSVDKEPISTVVVYTELTLEFRRFLKKVSEQLACDLQQQAVFVTLNSKAYLVNCI